jgi:hypothetical protein
MEISLKRTKPKVGDMITHTEPYFKRENSGKVIQLLAMQFVYRTEGGHIRHCMFSEQWTPRAKGSKS